MANLDGGRIVFLLSAMAALPVRRYPDYSVKMAAAYAGVRVLAMELAPSVLVNAVGVGVIGGEGTGEPLAGEVAMLSHTAIGRSGTIDEAVALVMFFCDPLNSYTNGQLLSADGGWTSGYGRDF